MRVEDGGFYAIEDQVTRPEAETPGYAMVADDMTKVVKALEAYRVLLEVVDDRRRAVSTELEAICRPALCDAERGLDDAMAEARHEISDLNDAIARFEEDAA